MSKKTENVLSIGDLHAPFEHADALEFVKAIRKKIGPTKIVCMGDEADMHALGNYDHDPDGLTSGGELEAAREHLKAWYKTFPDVEVLRSNHTERPFRAAFRAGISKLFIRDYRDFLHAPKGWNWHEQIIIDEVQYEHGEGFTGRNGAISCALGNMRSTVVGHIHSFAGVQFSANPRFLVFGFNVGCLIDKDKYAFAYGKKIKNKPILGVGQIERGVPRFIPMLLNSHGRWTGKLC